MNKPMIYRIRLICCLLLFTCLSACVSLGNSTDPRDPYESFNRSVYKFNEVMDDSLFEPIIRLYHAITPDFIDKGISNFFSNLNEIAVIFNDLLQLKIDQAISDISRFVINSTLGFLGFFDVSTSLGLPKHREDFGQTLAKWGFGSGPYIVVPFFGPSTIRDTAGFSIDNSFLAPVSYVDNTAHRSGLLTLAYIDFKADLMSSEKLISEAALDEYEFVKNAYFNLRDNLIHDRDPAMQEFEQFQEEL